MTEERDKLQTSTDALVSETYQAIADERAPEHLNRAILRDASNAARPRYLRSISWTRPLAWAATVTLCIALVLEVSDLPAPGPEALDGDGLKLELPQSGRDTAGIAADDAPSSRLEESIPASASFTAPQSVEMKAAAKQTAVEPELENRLLDAGRNEPARTREATAAFAPSERVTLRSAIGLSSVGLGCDETARATAETWYACIEELEASGFTDEAAQQGEALLQAFPDFTPQ